MTNDEAKRQKRTTRSEALRIVLDLAARSPNVGVHIPGRVWLDDYGAPMEPKPFDDYVCYFCNTVAGREHQWYCVWARAKRLAAPIEDVLRKVTDGDHHEEDLASGEEVTG